MTDLFCSPFTETHVKCTINESNTFKRKLSRLYYRK